jgi:hypothetical protein
VGENEVGNSLVGQCPGSIEIGVYELWFQFSAIKERGGGGVGTKIDARSPVVWARYSRFASADLMASSAEAAGRYLMVMGASTLRVPFTVGVRVLTQIGHRRNRASPLWLPTTGVAGGG